VSTVLQALQELEGKIAPADATAWTAEDRRWRWWTAGGVAAGILMVGIAAVVFFSSHSGPAPVARVPTAPVPVAPSVALAPPPPPPVSARGVPKLPTPVPVVKPPPPRPAAAPVPREPAATTAAPPVQAPPPAATPRRTEPAVRAGNEPRIQVGAIRYSQAPPERTVTLAIDGGTPLTLHQGESTGDLEVQLILPDGVYVRRGGHVWMVSADR